MSKRNGSDEWPIYNCHIHTFTRKHTPRSFMKFVLSDSEIGRINWPKVLLIMILFAGYVYIVLKLGQSLPAPAASGQGWSLAGYAILVLLEGFMAVLLLALVLVIVLLFGLWVAQTLVDRAIERRSVAQQRQPQSLVNSAAEQRSRTRNTQRVEGLKSFKAKVHKGQETLAHPNILVDALKFFYPPSSNDIFDRIARFIKVSSQPSQEDVFKQIREQYQTKKVKTKFIVLPMDMSHMGLGPLEEPIDIQHKQLLDLVEAYPDQIIPFFAADPRQPDIVEQVRKHVLNGKFRGIKIYPNLGYPPDHVNLMKIYEMCCEPEIPIMTHCSPGGIWRYGMSDDLRREYSQPNSYRRVFKEFPTLKICLAHFGGAEEWARRLNRKLQTEQHPEEPWVTTIYDMIADGETEFPNLYTDISYTAFTPKVKGLYIDLVDYLKVMLTNERVQSRVLFGSDYYMIEQERISEKEASILLRSRLGEDLYKKIAYTNPKEFLRRPRRTKADPKKAGPANGKVPVGNPLPLPSR